MENLKKKIQRSVDAAAKMRKSQKAIDAVSAYNRAMHDLSKTGKEIKRQSSEK